MQPGLVEVEAPYFLDKRAGLRLRVTDRALWGASRHFLRLEFCPHAAPSHRRRHYGWWDVPLKHLPNGETDATLDFEKDVLELPGLLGQTRIRANWRGLKDEPGYCMLHASLWDARPDPPRRLGLQSSAHVLTGNGLDLPLKQINIPVTDRCNLECRMCPRQNTVGLANVDIADGVLMPLLDAAPGLQCVMLQGLGEPLLYPRLGEVLRRLKRTMAPDSIVGLTTNATLLDDRTASQLLTDGVDFIYFSVDAATRETHEAIRRGSNFALVRANISNCVKARDTLGRTDCGFMMNMVMQDANLQEIPGFAALAAELGVESITYSYCLGAASGALSKFPSSVLQPLFETARQVADQHGLNVGLPPLEQSPAPRCFFMERLVLLGSGEVLPCHAMAPGYASKARYHSFGNVSKSGLRDIWASEDCRRFRGRVLSSDFPPECAGCDCSSYLVP